MKTTDNKQITTGRDKLRQRASTRFPDRKFVPDVPDVPEEGSLDDLDDAISEMMDEQDSKMGEMNAKLEKLQQLMYSDPQSAEFISLWLETGDPRAALVEVFGDDLSDLATEEGRNKFSGNLKNWRERKAKNDELSSQYDSNWNAFLEKLNTWGDGKGLDNEKKANVAARLIDVYEKGLTNAYDEDDFEMAYKALSYDKDVAVARQEGEVSGRNAKIQSQRRTRTPQEGMPPSGAGSRGMRMPAPQPPEKKNIWDMV